jgi:hypothetical protein
MKSLVEGWQNIWQKILQSPAHIPSRVAIPPNHVHNAQETLGTAFQPHEHYFQVRVNEMYLTYGRKWFDQYDPMVFVVSEFIYDKEEEAVPFVVGPMMMEKFGNGQKMPAGMVFSDTRVAGLHPYRGGRLTLSVVLCRVKRENYARKLLQIIESAASVLDFSTALSTYVKVGSVVLDGVEALLGLGDTDPLIGFRKEFDPDAGEVLEPSYFALIDMSESQLNTDELWVLDRRLAYGKSLAEAQEQPFRKADFVLYSISQTAQRGDVTTLPFYPVWERVVEEATVAKEENWENAKAHMAILYQQMLLSADLTPKQAEELADDYESKMDAMHDRVVRRSRRGEEEPAEPSELDVVRSKAVSILRKS